MQRTLSFDKTFVANIKRQLLEEQAQLEVELADISELPTFGASEDDAVQGVEATLEQQSVRFRLTHFLDSVRRSLRLIEAGQFGLCQNCQQPIERARLEAMPTATVCVSCSAKRH